MLLPLLVAGILFSLLVLACWVGWYFRGKYDEAMSKPERVVYRTRDRGEEGIPEDMYKTLDDKEIARRESLAGK
jgi:hypothetical protein